MKYFKISLLLLFIYSCNSNKSPIESEIPHLAKQFSNEEVEQIKNEPLEPITHLYENRIIRFMRKKEKDANFKLCIDSIAHSDDMKAKFLLVALKENLNSKPYDKYQIRIQFYKTYKEYGGELYIMLDPRPDAQ
jgi:hypothetical protein